MHHIVVKTEQGTTAARVQRAIAGMA